MALLRWVGGSTNISQSPDAGLLRQVMRWIWCRGTRQIASDPSPAWDFPGLTQRAPARGAEALAAASHRGKCDMLSIRGAANGSWGIVFGANRFHSNQDAERSCRL